MRLIVFDIDGTLVDSQHDIVEAQAMAFAAHGLPAPTREKALSVVGLSLIEAFRALVGHTGRRQVSPKPIARPGPRCARGLSSRKCSTRARGIYWRASSGVRT